MTFEDHVRQMMSNLLWQIAQLQFENEQLRAAIAKNNAETNTVKSVVVESSNGG